MIKIVALNVDQQDEVAEQEEVVATREAQEAIAENEYIRAIRLKSDGKDKVAMNILNELLESQVLNENIEDNKDGKLWNIKYNCHKNLAIILEEKGEQMPALQHYIAASLIDNTDVFAMHKFGQLALKLDAGDLAEYAFENCLARNPTHWRAAEGILTALCRNGNVMAAFKLAQQISRRYAKHEMADELLRDITLWFQANSPLLELDLDSVDCKQNEKFHLPDLFNNVAKSENLDGLKNEPKTLDLKQAIKGPLSWRSIAEFILYLHENIKELAEDKFFQFNFKDVMHSNDEEQPTVVASDEIAKTEDSACTNDEEHDISAVTTLDQPSETDATKNGETADNNDLPTTDFNNDDSDSYAKSDGCEANKNKPRRRCSDLHFLEQWGWHKNRRYSSRKKVEKEEVDTSLNSFLRRIFAKYTTQPSPEGKWPFNEQNNADDNVNFQCPNCKASCSETDFQKATQTGFENFLKKLQQSPTIDIDVLIYNWLKYMSLFWNASMPAELKQLYVEIFELYMTHFDLANWNQLTQKNYVASYRICLTFLELTVSKRTLLAEDNWQRVFVHLCFNLGQCQVMLSSETDGAYFELRLLYIQYLLYSDKSQYNECLLCLEQISAMLAQQTASFVLHLPNLGNICLTQSYVENVRQQYMSQIDISNIPKLYGQQLWPHLSDIIIANIESSNNNYENEAWFKDFKLLMEILLQCFWKMSAFEKCLLWAEKCLHYAVSHYLEETRSAYRQKLLADLINFITSHIEAVLLNEGYQLMAHLNESALARLLQNIIRLLVYQFEGSFEKNSNHGAELDFKRNWIILHQLAVREEDSATGVVAADNTAENINEDITETVPNSFLLLFTAHENLGKRQWCSNDNGEFLQYILDAVVSNLKAPIYDSCRDIIYEYIEQVTFCLFKYPQKKARSKHLEDHEAMAVKLTWPKALQLFDLYQPENLPEFNSYKLESISTDMEQMLIKMITLMPKDYDPSAFTQNVSAYIEGLSETLPQSTNDFSIPFSIKNFYYLLADFNFKNRDFMKAIKFYTYDLVVNARRFDSWAGMALSKASLIETKLNGLDLIGIETLWHECEQVLRCFECCINLNRFQTLLWIEYGSFCYTIHSYFSRHLKYNRELPSATYASIEQWKNKLLNIAYNCFSLTNSLQNSAALQSSEDANHDGNDEEKWLCQYMLGKISEKRKEEPKLYLNHYLMAANYLYESNATYPIKINHSNPTALSVEALEVFYRINAAIIKHITQNSQVSRNNGVLFKKVLRNLANSPFAFNKAKIDGNSLNMLKRKIGHKFKTGPTAGEAPNNGEPATKKMHPSMPSNDKAKPLDAAVAALKSPTRRDSQESSQSLSTTSSAVTTETSSVDSESDTESLTNAGNKNDAAYTLDELKLIYGMVKQNIEECATRFPEHYKSIYRLLHHFMNSPPAYCDLQNCEQLLMGQYKTSLGNVVNGLFYERKNNNLFNGIWRIPSSEIDRPGSFSAHLVKCVHIFIQYLAKTNNHKVLIDIALNLYKTPDADKRYIADAARKDLYQQCINNTLQILSDVLQQNRQKRDDEAVLNLLLDIYKIHKKCIKYMNQKEATFTKLLIEIYRFYVQDKVTQIPEHYNLLDLAIKLCVQEVTARKLAEKSSTNAENSTNLSDCLASVDANAINASSSPMPKTYNIPGLNVLPQYRNNPAAAKLTMQMFGNTGHATTNASSLDFSKIYSQQLLQQMLPAFGNDAHMQLFQDYYAKLLQTDKYSPAPITKQNEVNFSKSIAVTSAPYQRLDDPPNFVNDANIAAITTQQLKAKSSLKTKKTNNKPYARPAAASNDLTELQYEHAFYAHLLKSTAAVTSMPSTSSASSHSSYTSYAQAISKESQITPSNLLINSSSKSLALNLPDNKMDIKLYSSAMSTATTSAGIVSTANLSSDSILAPAKTLQQKLAERQKSCQLNEMNHLKPSNTPNAALNDCDDIIVLD